MAGARRWTYALLAPVAWLASWLPKSRRTWVVVGREEPFPLDNSRWFYLWASRQAGLPVDACWVTPSRTLVRLLRRNGLKAALEWSPRGLWTAARAAAIVDSNAEVRLAHLAARRAVKANFYHGVPLKHVGHDIAGSPPPAAGWLARARSALVHTGMRPPPDLLIAPSPEALQRLLGAFRLEAGRGAVAGYPRMDALFAPQRPLDGEEWPAWLDDRSRPLVVALPTWRSSGNPQPPWPWEELGRLAGSLGFQLVLKRHPSDSGPLPAGIADSPDVRLAPRGLDAAFLLARADVLLTDYSSAMFDFMALGRPWLLFTPDLADYARLERGLYEPVDGLVPGGACTTTADLLRRLRVALSGEPASQRAQRKAIAARFVAFPGPGSSKRACEAILARMGR